MTPHTPSASQALSRARSAWEATPPDAMTGVASARANAPVAAELTPSSAPSRAMSVWTIAAAPASSKRRASASASISTVLGPAFDRDPAVAGVDADGDAAGEGTACVADQSGVADRHGAEDHTMHAALQPRLDGGHVADAAAELDRDVDGVENRRDRAVVDRPAREGAVEIDDVEPGEAGRREGPRLCRRILGEDRGARHVSLHEPDAGAALQVDGGEQDHAAGSGGRSDRSLQ